jgi:hypothetical protein
MELEDDQAVREFAAGLRRSKAYLDDELVLECHMAWDAIHRCLTDGSLDPEGGDFPLNHCVLGGRRLHKGDGFEAVLIRPDIVPYVADATNEVRLGEFRDQFFELDPEDYQRPIEDKEFDRIWATFRQLQSFFEYAAAERVAVLFTVER